MTKTTKGANAQAADKGLQDVNTQQLVITDMKAVYNDYEGKSIGFGKYVKLEATSCTGEVAKLALTTAQAYEVADLLRKTAKDIDRMAGNLLLPF